MNKSIIYQIIRVLPGSKRLIPARVRGYADLHTKKCFTIDTRFSISRNLKNLIAFFFKKEKELSFSLSLLGLFFGSNIIGSFEKSYWMPVWVGLGFSKNFIG